ncbi:G-protein coupled receptor 161 [Biomphalaria pfeifferi]|uniref:G-protein coupled receptor 161 n=1 Tax=Biomphalaria pfeifferi TaxID=112525 RepID=A0AAD8F968_BIOPF|nr:G-protein coupled receptor 161 [Biomphalaria pfeifferi]
MEVSLTVMASNLSIPDVIRVIVVPENKSAEDTMLRSSVETVTDCSGTADNLNISTTDTTIMGALLSSVFLASVVANAFVFVVFCKRKSISMSNRFVANLTIGNCLNTIFVMPFALTSLITKEWIFGTFWCLTTGFLMNVIVSASIFTLVVISIDRYCAVVTPLHYSMRLTSRRCTLLIVFVWVAAILISSPPLMGWNSIEFQLDKMVCTVKWSSYLRYDRYYTFFLISFSFMLPLIAILWTYARMFRAAHGNIVRARRNSVIRVNSAATNQSDDSSMQQNTPINSRRRSSSAPIIRRLSQSSSRSSSLLWRKEEWKTAVTSFLVLFSFALCWTPYFVVMAVEAVTGRSSPLYPVTSHVSTVLAMFSCACNPLVYVFRSKVVRRELKFIFSGRANSDHEICVPHEFPRRVSVVRNESGRSLRSMADVEEEREEDQVCERQKPRMPAKKNSMSPKNCDVRWYSPNV